MQIKYKRLNSNAVPTEFSALPDFLQRKITPTRPSPRKRKSRETTPSAAKSKRRRVDLGSLSRIEDVDPTSPLMETSSQGPSMPTSGAQSTHTLGASLTPTLGGFSTPTPGASSTPAPGGFSTPTLGGLSTPTLGASLTPTPGASSTPTLGGFSTPTPGASLTPTPGGFTTPTPVASSTRTPGGPPTPSWTAYRTLEEEMKRATSMLKAEKRKTARLERQLEDMEMFTPSKANEARLVNALKHYLGPQASEIFRCQIENHGRKGKGRRYTDELKMVCLALSAQSTKCYDFLTDIFILPSRTTLDKITSACKVPPGINENIFKALQKKVASMSEKEKEVTFCLDEMHIKSFLAYKRDEDLIEGFVDYGGLGEEPQEFCNQALVWCVRGMFIKWKQPLGYILSSDATPADVLKTVIDDTMKALFNMGLKINVLVADQGTTNQKLVRTFLKATIKSPVYKFMDREIVVMFDPPHLLKSLRNNLLNKNYILEDGGVVTWDHFQTMVQEETAKPAELRLAPKLGEATHVRPTSFLRMKVKYAAQVFSNTTSAALSTYAVDQKSSVPKEADITAKFFKQVDMLFDCFQSTSLYSEKPYKGAMTDKSEHLGYLDKMDTVFRTMKMQKRFKPIVEDLEPDDEGTENSNEIKKKKKKAKAKRPPCLNGWRLTIQALKLLWYKVRKQYSELRTRNLNQDCLENLFGVIRSMGGYRDNPTAGQFRQSFKTALISDLLNLRHAGGANCEMDTARLLFDAKSLCVIDSESDQAVCSTTSTSSDSDNVNIYILDAYEENEAATLAEISKEGHQKTGDDSSLVDHNKLYYMAGVCAKKFCELHGNECAGCCAAITSSEKHIVSPDQIFTFLKAYSKWGDDFGALKVPSQGLVKLISDLDECCRRFLRDHANKPPCSKTIRRNFEIIQDLSWFLSRTELMGEQSKCLRDMRRTMEYFVRVRLYYFCNNVNQQLSSRKKNKENRKYRKICHF